MTTSSPSTVEFIVDQQSIGDRKRNKYPPGYCNSNEYKTAWKRKNAEKNRLSNAKYRANNKAKIKAANRRYYHANKDKAYAQVKRWEAANPDKVKAKIERQKRSPVKIACQLFNAAKSRSESYQIPFALTAEWIKQKIEVGSCPVTGHRFCFEPRSPWRPSIDRIDASRGYVPDNCQVVCCIYNYAKNSYQHSDVVEFARSLVAKEDANDG